MRLQKLYTDGVQTPPSPGSGSCAKERLGENFLSQTHFGFLGASLGSGSSWGSFVLDARDREQTGMSVAAID